LPRLSAWLTVDAQPQPNRSSVRLSLDEPREAVTCSPSISHSDGDHDFSNGASAPKAMK
jgi:hypothetical protein